MTITTCNQALKGCTGEYWPEVMTVQTNHNEVLQKQLRANMAQARYNGGQKSWDKFALLVLLALLHSARCHRYKYNFTCLTSPPTPHTTLIFNIVLRVGRGGDSNTWPKYFNCSH